MTMYAESRIKLSYAQLLKESVEVKVEERVEAQTLSEKQSGFSEGPNHLDERRSSCGSLEMDDCVAGELWRT